MYCVLDDDMENYYMCIIVYYYATVRLLLGLVESPKSVVSQELGCFLKIGDMWQIALD